jgi:fluoride ion exporter CrcB/FEX
LILPIILIIKKSWVFNFVQIFLVLGTIEWIRIIVIYVFERQAIGEPYVRLVIILGLVAVFTGLSTLVFRNQSLKERYKL